MKSSAIIVLSIVGVLGTTGAAMAVNGATLGSFDQGSIGQATEVLVPGSVPTDDPTPTPTPSSTYTDDDDNGLRGDGTIDDDAPGFTDDDESDDDSSDESEHESEDESEDDD